MELHQNQRLTRLRAKKAQETSPEERRNDVMIIEESRAPPVKKKVRNFNRNKSRGMSSTSRNKSLQNLQLGSSFNKAKSFAFDRKRGEKICSDDRHWILRTYWWMKAKSKFSENTDTEIQEMVADIAGCCRASVSSIVREDSIESEDQRGHVMKRKIPEDIEEEVKQSVVSQLKQALDQGIPISSKDVRSWIEEDKQIDIHKTTMLNYLWKWGISWERLRKEEFRKERDYVLAQRCTFLKEALKELTIPEKSCRHRHGCECLRRRKLVFVDESYIHQHHVANFGLTFDNTPLKKPSGKGKRIVIGAALSEDGWIGLDGGRRLLFDNNDGTYSAGSVKFWTGNVGGDYHHNFNGEVAGK